MFILEALWFFVPAVAANQCPGLAAKLDLPGNRPVSTRWLGANKTWAAYYAAAFGATLAIYLQRLAPMPEGFELLDYERPELWLVGLAFGLGTVLGDHAKSFVKRRFGIPPGDPWWPFDQLDYVVGSLLLVAPFSGWIGGERVATLVVTVLLLNPLVNGIGYRLKLRKVPW